MSRIAGLIAISLAATAFGQVPEKYANAIKTIETFVERERVDAGINGLSIAIVEDQKIVWSKGFGFADAAKTRRATGDTVYRVGMVPDLITAVVVLQLVEEKKLDLIAAVTNYLPNFRPNNPYAMAITVKHLITHRSGLMFEPPVGGSFDLHPPPLAKIIESLNGLPIAFEPGTMAKHSNTGIAVLARIIEIVDGRTYSETIHERILKPMKMDASKLGKKSFNPSALAEGQIWTIHGREFSSPPFDSAVSPSEGLFSTANDLAKLLSGMPINEDKLKFIQSILETSNDKADCGPIGFSTGIALWPHGLNVAVIGNRSNVDRWLGHIANTIAAKLVNAKAGFDGPEIVGSKPVTRDESRKLAGKYGAGPTHELFEASGRLFYCPGTGGHISEMRMTSRDQWLSGRIDDGTEFMCDGALLGFNQQKFHRRIAISGASPDEPTQHFTGLIGEYGWDHHTLYILEKDQKLHALVNWFYLCPLKQESKDAYQFQSGSYEGEKLAFKRGPAGKATELNLSGAIYSRRQLDGEDGKTFRIAPLKPIEELRKLAAASTPPEESGKFRESDLVELSSLDPTFKIDLRYASDNNFLGTPLYPKTAKAYMQRPAAEALARVSKNLASKGYGLWVFDPYRPWTVTKMFWEATPEKMRMFVADPSKGSRHNRGCAVDLTLYDLKSGKPVEMVSGYDEFSDRAYPNYWGGTSRQRWHRELLRHAMEDEGFTVYEAEWWHFDYKDWRSYRIGNQGFDELGKK